MTTADASSQVDTAPDAFSFVDQTAVALSTPVTSNSMIVNGINARTEITIGDVQYSVNGGGHISAAGEVNNCDSVTIKLDSSASYASSTQSTLIIGGVSGSFSITTLEQIVLLEATPEAFNFSDQSDVAIGVTMISNSVVVSGINGPARLAIRNGQYSINGGIYTAGESEVNKGDAVAVQLTVSSNYSTAKNATIIISCVTDIDDRSR